MAMWDSAGLFSTLLQNVILCPILLFILYKLLSSDKLGSIPLWKVYRPKRPQDSSTLFTFSGHGDEPASLKRSLFNLVDPWVAQNQSAESVLYLTFMRLLAQLFLVVAVVCPPLMGVNHTEDYLRRAWFFPENYKEHVNKTYEEGIFELTTRNLPPESTRFYAILIFSLPIVYEVAATVFKMVRYLKVAKANIAPPTTAVVNSVTKASMKAARNEVWGLVPAELRSKVSQIEVPRAAVAKMLDLMEEKKKAVLELERWFAKCEKLEIKGDDRFAEGHKDLMISESFCGKKVNALVHLQKTTNKLTKQIDILQQKFVEKQPIVGVAYITFKTPAACAKFVSGASITRRPAFAPEPETILWRNVGKPFAVVVAGNVVVTCLLILLAMMWAAILAFFGSLDNLSEWIPVFEPLLDTNSELRGYATTNMPIIALAVLNILLPIVMRALTQNLEFVTDSMHRETRVLRKVAIFGLITAVVLQSALQGMSDSLEILSNPSQDQIMTMVAGMIVPSTKGYFVGVIVQAAFIGSVIKMFKIGDLLIIPLMSSFATTHNEFVAASKRKPFIFSEEYAFSLIIAGFTMVFSINMPYIPVFGFLYFLIRFLVDRAVLCDIYPKARKSSLKMVPTAINIFIGIFICLQAFGIIALVGIKERYDVMAIGFVPLVVTFVVTGIANMHLSYIMGPQYMADLYSGAETKSPPALPTITDLIFGGWEEEPATPLDAEAAEKAEETSEDAVSTSTKCPSFAESPISEYCNVCKLYKNERVNHAEMAAASWYVKAEDQEVAGPWAGIVKTEVFFDNIKASDADAAPKEANTSDPFGDAELKDVDEGDRVV